MTLIDRVRKRAKELDDALIRGIPRWRYDLQMVDDRQLLEDVEKELAASRINHPVPGQ